MKRIALWTVLFALALLLMAQSGLAAPAAQTADPTPTRVGVATKSVQELQQLAQPGAQPVVPAQTQAAPTAAPQTETPADAPDGAFYTRPGFWITLLVLAVLAFAIFYVVRNPQKVIEMVLGMLDSRQKRSDRRRDRRPTPAAAPEPARSESRSEPPHTPSAYQEEALPPARQTEPSAGEISWEEQVAAASADHAQQDYQPEPAWMSEPEPEPAPAWIPEPEPEPAPLDPVDAALADAEAAVDQGQPDQAINGLRPLVQQNANRVEIWWWLGQAYIQKSEWASAELCLKRAQMLGHPQAGDLLTELQNWRSSGGA